MTVNDGDDDGDGDDDDAKKKKREREREREGSGYFTDQLLSLLLDFNAQVDLGMKKSRFRTVD